VVQVARLRVRVVLASEVSGAQVQREPLHLRSSAVGLACVPVWCPAGKGYEEPAEAAGIAFQLTNILRDLGEDRSRGRVYLPRDEWERFGCPPESWRGMGPAFRELMRFQVDRAESYYRKAADLGRRVSRDSRPTLTAMTEIYHGLLRKVAAHPERVLRERVSLSLFSKLCIGWRASRAK